jgi:glycosyltransferase involved in cell wall biosynthesis
VKAASPADDAIREGRLRVAIVSPHPVATADSGDRLRTTQLVGALAAEGIDAHIWTWAWPHHTEEPDTTLVNGAPSSRLARLVWRTLLGARRKVNPYAIFAGRRARRNMRRALVEAAPDVIDFQHSFTWQPVRVPTVVTFHNVESHKALRAGEPAWRRLALTRLERQAAERCRGVVVFSSEDGVRLAQLAAGSAPIHVVALGYRPKRADRQQIRERATTAAFIGSFDYNPNREAAEFLVQHEHLLRAAGMNSLLLVGRHADRYFTSSTWAEVRADVPDVGAAIRDADYLVVPISSGGGTRVKIIEAFALGLPVATTRIGIEGLGAIDGQHALIVDSPLQIAHAVSTMQSLEVRRRLAAEGRALWAREFSPEAMARGMADVYRSALRD